MLYIFQVLIENSNGNEIELIKEKIEQYNFGKQRGEKKGIKDGIEQIAQKIS